MEKFSKAFFSMRAMAVAMLIFLLAIAAATFIESAYDIQAAKIIIYNALWFEILLVYLGINLIANIFKYKMFQKQKAAILVFHVSFIIILIGAAITRYISFEGLMLIREGQKSNFIYSSDPYLWFKINDGKMQYTYSQKQFMSMVTDNDFSIDVDFPGHKTPISIEYVKFEKKMVDTLVINDSIRGYALELITEGMRSNYLEKGGFLMAGDIAVSFEKKDAMPGVQLFEQNGKIMVRSGMPMRYLPMSEMQKARQSGGELDESLFVEIPADSTVPFQTTTLYQIGDQQIVFKQRIQHAKKMRLPSGNRNVGSDYLTLKIKDGTQEKIVTIEGGMGAIPEHAVFSFNGLTYELEYGSTKFEIPFYIECRDFQLDRYPGSTAASSFASEVTIIDDRKNYKSERRIFMNNVMDYGGYRFFQSSYDPDEKGTRLSVNHDWWGTNVTYLGYLLMAIGMILSLVAPVGRFKELNNLIKKTKQRKDSLMKLVTIALFCLGAQTFNAQEHDHAHDHDHAHETTEQHNDPQRKERLVKPVFRMINEEHSDKLAHLLVQDFQGRIIPMHTLCDELLRKISRKNTYEGNNAIQVILSMHMYPDHWMQQEVIQVPGAVKEQLGITEGYVSYADLSDNTGQFRWMQKYDEAHQRLESQRNEFDKKLIKLVERFQVVQAIFNWQYMKIIPVKGEKNNTWFVPLSMELMQLDSTSSSLALRYLSGVDQAAQSGKYGEVDDLLNDLMEFQRKAGSNVVPSASKVNMEIRYNKMGIFKNSLYAYMTLGLFLLFLFFIRIFYKGTERTYGRFKTISNVFVALLIVTFVYHGSGLAMRWYISGHAPWSNGYEAVVFIAWVTMIAGFFFAKKNPVVLAGTAILACLMIFVTEMNLLDPEITPLQPVLKSYWLMIHVAIITGSYGFLGLGAILGLLNLILYIFRTKKNGQLVTLNINEITYVSEMTITVGLFMLTIGTFLGGVWANESWGRYWGWDPKETWALVSVLVYAVILHLRFIPALKGKFLFNTVSFWGYSAILFTFFGVNFILVGLHSYAQGDSLVKMPNYVYVLIFVFTAITVIAAVRNKMYAKTIADEII